MDATAALATTADSDDTIKNDAVAAATAAVEVAFHSAAVLTTAAY